MIYLFESLIQILPTIDGPYKLVALTVILAAFCWMLDKGRSGKA